MILRIEDVTNIGHKKEGRVGVPKDAHTFTLEGQGERPGLTLRLGAEP